MSVSLLLIALICASQPPAMAATVRNSDWPSRRLVFGGVGAAVIAIVVTGLGDPILSFIEVTPPTFRLAAAVVLGVWGARWLVLPPSPIVADPHARSSTADALAVALLANPAVMLLAVAGGTEHGVVLTAGWIVIALALAVGAQLVAGRLHPWALRSTTWLLGALAIVIAISAGIDAARTV